METPTKKIIFLIGANSNFIQELINEYDLTTFYDKIIYVSHRPYNFTLSNKKESFVNFSSREDMYKELSSMTYAKNSIDILFSNTPTNLKEMNDRTLEWAKYPRVFMQDICKLNNINRCIYLGSTLALVPIIKDSLYKRLKRREFSEYIKFRDTFKGNVCYILLPPIDDNLTGIGYLFKEQKIYWINEVMKSLNTKDKIIIPRGLNGILTRILLSFKRIKL